MENMQMKQELMMAQQEIQTLKSKRWNWISFKQAMYSKKPLSISIDSNFIHNIRLISPP